MELLLGDSALTRAISNIRPRSERQPDLEVLEKTYVETGVLPQLDNPNNQVLYGRRGTGKSHVLRVLGAAVNKRPKNSVVYIDIRLLGSAQLMADDSQPLTVRCVSVFKDLLSLMQSQLLDLATAPDHDGSGIEEVSAFAQAIMQKSAELVSKNLVTSEHSKNKDSLTAQAGIFPTPKLNLELGNSNESGFDKREEYNEVFRETVVFAEISTLLDASLKALGVQTLYVLIDEWTAIPPDVQPYIAEFLKRSFFPSNRVAVKIASLEYRSHFGLHNHSGGFIGFELGSDLSANLDLDEYYVYDRNPNHVVEMFLELLYKHVSAELPDGYLLSLGVKSANSLKTRLFTESATFVELVRAGEGVVRDFLGIFSSSYFRATRSGRKKIDLNSVEEASRDWYETDKSTVLSPHQRKALNKIMTDVIGKRQAKMFLLAREHSGHQMIESLFDLRLIHLISRGYSDRDNPGLRYNIYSLDYGTYVDLKRTRNEPEGLLPMFDLIEPEQSERIVPFADKRSIRRVILDPQIFETL